MEPVPDEPALVIDDNILAIADLHIGIEVELNLAGIFVPSQIAKLAHRAKRLVEETGAEVIVVLGDVKHYIPGTAALERRDVPRFFDSLLEVADEVHVAAGNHDALIRPYVPRAVKFHGPRGFAIDDVGFVHGHAWPSPSVAKCRTLVMGHNHPAVVLVDDLGGRSIQPAWVRYGFRRRAKGRERLPSEGLLVPSFNEMCGGVAVNDVHTELLGPLVTDEIANLATADVHLLDGAYLGRLRDIMVDSGLKPRDFRQ